MVRLLAFSGIRFGELAALKVKRVNLLRRRMDIPESVTEVNERAMFGSTKNDTPRSVPVPRSLTDDLPSAAMTLDVYAGLFDDDLDVGAFSVRCSRANVALGSPD